MAAPRDYWAQSNANPARRRAILEAAIPEDRSGCWEWPGTRTRAGYGQMRGGSKVKVYVHRVSYETFVGPIVKGHQIDHLCRNRACFNPEHLEPVTNRENCARGMAPGAIAARTGMCVSGRHAMAGHNLIQRPNGDRLCRSCYNEWQRKRYAKASGARDASGLETYPSPH